MKKILLLFTLFSFAIATSNAQSIDIYNSDGSANITNDTIVFWHPVSPSVTEPDFSHGGFAKIHNNSTDTVTIRLRRIERQVITGSEDYLCWGITCFGKKLAGTDPDWDVNDESIVLPGDTAGGLGLIVYLQPNDNIGEAVYEYRFYNKNDTTISASTYVRWSISLLTDVNEIFDAVQHMEVYPNPATDQFTIDFNAKLNAANQEIIIRDMLGKLVQRETISGSQAKFNFTTDGMQGGIYFVSYVLDGEVMKTTKLVVH